PGPLERLFRAPGAGRLERLPRVGQLSPRALVVRVADPDIQVGVDPRAGEDRAQRRRRSLARVRQGDGANLGVAAERPVERPKEGAALALVVRPPALAVEG